MLCPKCGHEYEGTECPFCSKPEIIINQSDYLERKRAYEEKKQAEQRSASSDSVQKNTAAQPVEILSKIKDKSAAFSRVRPKRMQSAKRNKKEPGTETAHQHENKRKTSKWNKKHWVKGILALVLVLLLVAGGIGIYSLAARKTQVLYMSYNSRIYNVSGLDTQLVCEEDEAVFEADDNTFYTPEFPREVNKNQIVQRMASSGGDYFAAVTYDESAGKYTLYLWNDKNCLKVAEGTKEKDIKYISSKGSVLYTDTDMVNDEWAVGGVELYIYEASKGSSIFEHGVLTALEEDLQSVYVYAQKETVIFLGNDNALYTYQFGRESKNTKRLISDEAGKIYAMSSDTDYIYNYQAQTVNESENAAGFIYNVSSNYYYHAVSDKETEDVSVGQATGSGIEFIYEKNSGIYLISADSIRYATAEKDEIPVYSSIDRLGKASDMVYLSSEGRLLFINAEGSLVSVKKGTAKVLAEQVADGSLSVVDNTQKGITYIREGIQYYRSSPSSQEVRMMETEQGTDTRHTLLYKNRLYFYDAAGQLYSCTAKGKDNNIVGEVERFWLGTE